MKKGQFYQKVCNDLREARREEKAKKQRAMAAARHLLREKEFFHKNVHETLLRYEHADIVVDKRGRGCQVPVDGLKFFEDKQDVSTDMVSDMLAKHYRVEGFIVKRLSGIVTIYRPEIPASPERATCTCPKVTVSCHKCGYASLYPKKIKLCAKHGDLPEQSMACVKCEAPLSK